MHRICFIHPSKKGTFFLIRKLNKTIMILYPSHHTYHFQKSKIRWHFWLNTFQPQYLFNLLPVAVRFTRYNVLFHQQHVAIDSVVAWNSAQQQPIVVFSQPQANLIGLPAS